MTWEELKTKQQNDLDAYWRGRTQREAVFRQEQQDILTHCSFTGPKGEEIQRKILRQQLDSWMDSERNEFSALLDAHAKEKDAFIVQEQRKQQLGALLTPDPKKQKDRGRN